MVAVEDRIGTAIRELSKGFGQHLTQDVQVLPPVGLLPGGGVPNATRGGQYARYIPRFRDDQALPVIDVGCVGDTELVQDEGVEEGGGEVVVSPQAEGVP